MSTPIVDIEFQDLSFRVSVKASKKQPEHKKSILHSSSGIIRGGRLTAIMGPSGAGKVYLLIQKTILTSKTTLLNMIAELAKKGSNGKDNVCVKGDISGKVSLLSINYDGISKDIGYVEQDDVILSTMTVREATIMAAWLRLPSDTFSDTQKKQRADDVLATLGLDHVADNRIGDPLKKGISGGERKRCSIGMALTTDPDVLLLDEPTSGLDSLTAFSVVKVLRSLVHGQSKTVVATVHQPNSDIFQLFDDVIFLHHGHIVYHGPVASVIEYFKSIGFECPPYSNPADYLFMTVLNDKLQASSNEAAVETEDAEKGLLIQSIDESGSLYAEQLSQMWLSKRQNFSQSTQSSKSSTFVEVSTAPPAPFFTQFWFLFNRAFWNVLRNPMLFQVKFSQSVFVGLLLGLIYMNVDDRGFEQIQDRGGVLFFLALNCLMMHAFGILTVFAEEKIVFCREYRNGYYTLPAYFLSKTLVELPFQLVFPFIQATISFFLIFTADAQKFIVFAVITILIANVGTGLGIMAAALFEDVKIAQAVIPMLLLPLMIFSGLFINISNLPAYFTWIKWISPIKYGYAAFMQNAYQGWSYVSDSGLVVTGDSIIREGGFDEGGSWSMWGNTLMLLAFYAVFFLLAYVFLWRSTLKYSSRLQ